MFYSKINSITFNNGESVAIGDKDIVLFVGANNVGKTQALNDIFRLFGKLESQDTRVVSAIATSHGDVKELKSHIIMNSSRSNRGSQYSGYQYNYPEQWLDCLTNMPEQLRDYIVSFIKTDDRLSQVIPPQSVESYEAKTHPIHYLAYDKNLSSKISEYFEHAFGTKLCVNQLIRKTFPLCMGEMPSTPENTSMNDALEEWRNILAKYPLVHEQGDGIRSFTGIILNLIIKHYGIFLIDEPESFLHPPQAYYLGSILPELIGEDRQAFISTHNSSLINGLIEKAADRVKIIRVSREVDINSFTILNSGDINEIWKNPLLKYSNIMEGLFHKYVVLCESDSDCQLYSTVYNHLCDKRGHSPEALFVHCGGKKRMKQIISYLKSMSVEYRCIPDIDVLDDRTTIKELFESTGGNWDIIDKDYNSFVSSLNGGKGTIYKKVLQKNFTDRLSSISNDTLSRADLDSLKQLLHPETKWSILKQGGQAVIPSGDGRNAYNRINDELMKHNIFLVPVGELERFIPEVGGHGPSWSSDVIEQYPNMDDRVYDSITAFVDSWGIC